MKKALYLLMIIAIASLCSCHHHRCGEMKKNAECMGEHHKQGKGEWKGKHKHHEEHEQSEKGDKE